ncbi:MAG: hypothetical protein WBF68_05560 [Atribacterota bacterium]
MRINKWSSIITKDSSSIVIEKLDSLGKRKKQIENGIQSLENMISDIERDTINKELVMLTLNKFTEVFDHLQPYKQKELLKLVIHKAILRKNEIKIALYGRLLEKGLFLMYLKLGYAPRQFTGSPNVFQLEPNYPRYA